MKFFKKREKANSYIVAIEKAINIMNCNALGYDSVDLRKYIDNVGSECAQKVKNTKVDDLNCDCLDSFITASFEPLREKGLEIHTHNLSWIQFAKGVVLGKRKKADGYIEYLRDDLPKVNSEIKVYRQIQKEKGIF